MRAEAFDLKDYTAKKLPVCNYQSKLFASHQLALNKGEYATQNPDIGTASANRRRLL
jgi:hypothetical protein